MAKQLPANVVYESEETLGFTDIRPQAPVHLVFIPKKHVSGISAVTSGEGDIVGPLIKAANKTALEQNISESGFRLVINSGVDARLIARHAPPGTVLVLKSTVPVGTNEKVTRLVKEAGIPLE